MAAVVVAAADGVPLPVTQAVPAEQHLVEVEVVMEVLLMRARIRQHLVILGVLEMLEVVELPTTELLVVLEPLADHQVYLV